MTTISLTVGDATPRETALRQLAYSTGIALVRWAHRRPARSTRRLTHEQQARRLATQQAVARQRDSLRYGIAQ